MRYHGTTITPDVLRRLLRFDPDTGKLFWLWCDAVSVQRNGQYAGKEALNTRGHDGYCKGKVMGVTLLAHRVIWAIVYGRWPEHYIDHINMVRSDNRLSNLREATRSENGCNRPAPKNNISGVKGVDWNKTAGKWQARIRKDGKSKRLGLFDTVSDAAMAYSAAAAELHGEFANYGGSR